MQKNKIQISEDKLERLVGECIKESLMELADEGKGKLGNWFKNKFGRNQTPQGTQTTDYSRINQANDPFAPPKQHPMTQGEKQAVDNANKRSEVFQAREQVKEALKDRSYYIGLSNKMYANAKNLCKQYGLNLGEIMKEMGLNNSATKKYDDSVTAANNMQQMNADYSAMDEGKQKNKRTLNEAQLRKIVESVVLKTLKNIKK